MDNFFPIMITAFIVGHVIGFAGYFLYESCFSVVFHGTALIVILLGYLFTYQSELKKLYSICK